MKVAILAESFLPHMNGVTHSLLQVLRHLERHGHEALVIAPGPGPVDESQLHGARLVLLPSAPLPGYPAVRIAATTARRLAVILREFGPDVVHLASPFVLGWHGVRAAELCGIPAVAIYQTDVPAYAMRYGLPGAVPALKRHVARLHRRAALTLAPSTSAVAALDELGAPGVRMWRRGVDVQRFHPSRRDERVRAEFAEPGETIVGYVGRLAPEKQVDDLRVLAEVPGVRLVVVGDGPSRADLERALPDAVFTGHLGGERLAEAMAAFDVFVHPGEHETFCQTVQEAHASGVPVVAVGAGGPLDLVRQSVDGWLYRPGDLDDLRARVADLAGDRAKREAFGRAARAGVEGRGWAAICDELLGHYRDAIAIERGALAAAIGSDDAPEVAAPAGAPMAGAQVAGAPVVAAPVAGARAGGLRFVAIGDSLTEGLCDDSRQAAGQYRGWADRLAMLLAMSQPAQATVEYANLAVRSRRTAEVMEEQLPKAIGLGADLIAVFVGSNDLVGPAPRPVELVSLIGRGIRAAREAGAEVLVVTPFLPDRGDVRVLRGRFARFNRALREVARQTGAHLVDVEHAEALTRRDNWAEDRVHLNSAGHRALAYAAARVLKVPDADALAALERAMHDDDADAPIDRSLPAWLRTHAVPWALRRLQGRRAGDGLSAKHDAPIAIRVPVVAPISGAIRPVLLDSTRLPDGLPHGDRMH